MSVLNKAEIIAIMGASGSGKSTAIKQAIKAKKPKRLIIIDPMREYGDFAEVMPSLTACYLASRKKSFKISFTPTGENKDEQFKYLCELAFKLGDCWLIVDELSVYTSASYAPAEWSDCTMRGRHKGLTVIGASQRPARIDKDFFSNATVIRTGRLNSKGDVQTLADVLFVDKSELMALAPLEYIQRDTSNGEVTRGMVKI